MNATRLLAGLGVMSLLLWAPAARAQCPIGSLEADLYEPATDLARTWSVMDILLATEDGQQPAQWPPHSVKVKDGNEEKEILNAGEDNPSLTGHGATPEERWRTAYAKALERFHQYTRACTAEELVGVVSLTEGWASDAFGDPTALEALERYAQTTKPRSLLIARSVGHLGGLPVTRPLVLALSQTFTRGQPGIAPSLAISPMTHARDSFLRHLVLSASGLIINPAAAPGTGGVARPIAASFEGHAGSSSNVRVEDWYREVLDHSPRNVDELNRLRKDTLRRLVADYIAANPGDDTARRGEVFAALRSTAFQNFQDDVFTYYKHQYILPAERRKTVFDWSLALRGRYTRDATWVAEVADLAALGLDGSFDFQFANLNGFKFSLAGGLLASSSWYPTQQGWTRIDTPPAPGASSAWGLLADANLGFTLFVPAESEGSVISAARLSVLGLARGQVRPGADSLRFGFNATLEVPVSNNVTLAGTYTLRCQDRSACVASSGLTFAVAGLD
jgi:hypothetical protein